MQDSLSNQENKESKIPKILLMGKAGVGKTSMRAIIFANCAPRDTFVLGWTHDVLESRLRFMGNKMLNLLDCGGQNEFIRQYLDSKREQIFSNVEILVFVITVEKPKGDDKDLHYFEECVEALEEYSKDAKVFVLIHKMDLIADHRKQSVFEKRQKEVMEKSKSMKNVTCFPTSIWEVSLYKAWTKIVSTLVSDMKTLELNLEKLAIACNAEEVILFEKSTFLLTSHYSKQKINDDQRYSLFFSLIFKSF
jgi:Ras-related GTP-binding protein A/B